MIKRACVLSICLLAVSVWSGPIAADNEPEVFLPVKADTSRPLRDIIRERQVSAPALGEEVEKPREIPNQIRPDFLHPTRRAAPASDPTRRAPLAKSAPTLGLSFDGYDNNDNIAVAGGQVAPPDPNGDVGKDFYIQYLNIGWKVFNKADGSLAGGPFIGNTFWAGFGGLCESGNAGDPIVLYDELAERWIFSQFAAPASAAGLQCIAISTTSDPMGPYHRYSFAVPGVDYPKIGIFSDGAGNSGYYFSTNNFNPGFIGVGVIAAERDKMLVGDPTAQFISFLIPPGAETAFSLQPGHLEGTDLPAAGTCNVFVQSFDDEVFGVGGGPDGYRFWEFCPDFATPANSTLSAPTFVDAGVEFDSELCGFAPCIPQPGTAQTLDTLSQFTMYRATMRVNPSSAPGATRMVLSHSVDVGGDQAGVRWVEFELGLSPTIADQGVFAPDGDSRWLPSIAMDVSGNIGVAYSRGSATRAPSVYYTGREMTDPAGMLQAEQACVDSVGVQTGTNRWVDYSSLSVDPEDQCTFWYTTEYYPVTSTFTWGTRVCSFRFDSCGVDRVVLSDTSENTEQLVCAPGNLDDIDLAVSLSTVATDPVTLDSSGLPSGFSLNYTINPVDPTPGTSSAQIAVDGTVVDGDYSFALTGSATGLQSAELGVNVTVSTAAPGATTLIAPPNGIKDIGGNVTFEWAVVPGATSYQLEVSEFGFIVVDEVSSDTTLTVSMDLPPGDYFWRVTAQNACGESTPSAVNTFSVAAPAQSLVLLVDDDDNSPNVVNFFADALTNIGLTFDVFDTGNSDINEPDLALISDFQAVVWSSGDDFGGTAGPSAASEAALDSYLTSGGCLLMSSQDYVFDKGVTPFMSNFLGVDSAASDITQTTVTGQGVFAGLGPYSLDFLAASLSNFSDELNPGVGAIGFQGNAGIASQVAATTVSGATFETAFLGFPFPAIPTAANREDVMGRFLLDQCQVAPEAGGSLTGTVTVAGTNIPVVGAVVTATRGGATVQAVTDADGQYDFASLTAGFYVVAASAPNSLPVDPVINVEVLEGGVTIQDFQVDAGAIVYDSTTLIETLGSNDSVTNPLTINNVGTLAIDFLVNIGNFDFGLPAGPLATSGHNNRIGQHSSAGLSAALTAPERLRGGPADVTAAPGDFLIQAPFPEGAPLGITMSPSGDVWVADLFSGNTVRYNQSLFIQEVFAHPTGLAVTPGIAYDTVNDTLWWLNGVTNQLVEGNLDGTATGGVISVTVSPGGLAAGVEYDPVTDAFYYIDIAADDIYAVDRSGAVLIGYPVPQTDLDDGSGIFGNGLDVIDGNLDVNVGTAADGQVARSVLTDLFGNNTGGETPFAAIPDTFINDAVRSRIDPNQAMYVVGNATSTIYVVEPVNLALARDWASTEPQSGSIPAGDSLTLDLTYDSTGLPFDTYQAQLTLGGNFVNQVDAKPLGLIVEGSPAISLSFTAYLGSDNGEQCLLGGSETLPAEATQAITFCVDLTNSGDTQLTDPSIEVPTLGVSRANMILKRGDLPWVAGERLLYYFVVAVPDSLPSAIVANVSADPTNRDGGSIPGPGTQSVSDEVTVEQGNTAPVARNRNVRTDEDVAVFVRLRASDVDGDALSFTVTSGPSNGTITGVPPILTYTPNANFNGLDSLTFVASDGIQTSNQATVAITVDSVNDLPVANPQNLATSDGNSIPITLTATDVETAVLDFALVSLTSNGALTGVPPNLTYTPNSGFVGTDAFLFVAFDGEAPSAETAVTITVTAEDGGPIAIDQDDFATEDVAHGLVLQGFDPQGDALSFTIVTPPQHGQLQGTAPELTYIPSADFFGNDSFTFIVNDGRDNSTPATVRLFVAPVNDVPTVVNDLFEVSQGTPLNANVSLNDYDIDEDTLSYQLLSEVEHGTLELNTDGSFTYTPNAGFSGTETFTYGVSDGKDLIMGQAHIQIGEVMFRNGFE